MPKYYPKGISKISICLCGLAYFCVLFAKRTYGGPPAEVQTRNEDGRLTNTAYVYTRNKSIHPL
jgi:hypothetical protein